MGDHDRADGTPPDFLEREEGEEGLSRRDLLKGASALGISFAVPMELASESKAAEASPAAAAGDSFQSFTPAEAETMCAIVERIIPKDENGPGAIEAGVPRYIDRLLRSDHNTYHAPINPDQILTEAYAGGLKAVDAYAQQTHGAPFASLSPELQDSILHEMQANHASGFTPDSRTFFNLIRAHAVEGMFGDPYYGGNINFVGWDLISYPGIKLAFTEEDQRLDVTPLRVRKGTTDYAVFSGSKKGL
jgi:gluconate 2-dehydrogenase gamma chain